MCSQADDPTQHGDTLRAALLRIFDMAEDRPDIREVARAALAASATDEGPRSVRESQLWDADPIEYVLEDGRRFAWSESNVQYEEVPDDGASFALLRKRLAECEAARPAVLALDVERVADWLHDFIDTARPEDVAIVIKARDTLREYAALRSKEPTE